MIKTTVTIEVEVMIMHKEYNDMIIEQMTPNNKGIDYDSIMNLLNLRNRNLHIIEVSFPHSPETIRTTTGHEKILHHLGDIKIIG